ncbi:PAAR domain-containing protein [Photobacterium leiognathi]|uniref:PAAR domain-containing protein n=1 Tax=Photobacterium leiognathi TaxID=553611 RepID=UPI00298131C4|nr:PAAR domain-containing protein [Photobacterium leiognathi]
MSNDVITVGCKTTTGGTVISGNSGVRVNGKKIALVGDIATCLCGKKNCKGKGVILPTSPRAANVRGVNLAKAGDFVDTGCGNCFLVTSTHQVSLGTSMKVLLNMGSNVNIGNNVNING